MGSNVTLKEIAQELGMSAMTASRALNNKDNVDKNTKKTGSRESPEYGIHAKPRGEKSCFP